MATSNGLYLLNRDTGQYQAFTSQYGLPAGDVYRILEDDSGNLWLFTYKDLVKFNPENKSVRHYDKDDGLDIGGIVYGVCKGKSGEMFCGGNDYIVSFFPDSLKDNPHPPEIVLTNFTLDNKAVRIGTDSPLSKSITEIATIHLNYAQNVLSFDFAALDYTAPEKIQYAYKLEGLDRDWVYCGNQHSAFYTNLDPGKYTFQVKGTNSDGVWNEDGAFVKLVIHPPWWQTKVAYVFYICSFICILIVTWRLQLRRIHLRNDLKMRTFESEKLKEVDHLKSRFFANISHEFRTPITLILGPLDKLLQNATDKETKSDLNIMRRNAKRLLRLINHLLDLSKFEAGKMQLQTRHENIVPLINRFVQSFESQAKLKEIEFVFSSDPPIIWLYIDIDKLENIIYNLVSNALKFTPAGGRITIAIKQKEPTEKYTNGYVDIRVSDTGAGLQPDHLDKIFDRFYQVDESSTREHEGSGIGLALTKELVQLHQGDIFVESKPGKGATFTVRLPMGRDHLTDKEIIAVSQGKVKDTVFEIDKMSAPFEEDTAPKKLPHNKKAPILLIVEDNHDLRDYMSDILSSDYRVKEAPDGEAGLQLALKLVPDLIISDVMMPRLNGIEFCKRLKTDERTSHIPVVLLTARAGLESKLEGLETGADDYIVKPFNTQELQLRVKNLLESRRKLRQRFSKKISMSVEDMAITSADERFMKRLLDILHKHLSESDYSVAQLAHEIGLSRVQLHRKLHALTDHSTSDFIRNVRLQRAAELLQHQFGNIAEITYKVGFNHPSYFSKCFREQFGELPHEYASRHRAN